MLAIYCTALWAVTSCLSGEASVQGLAGVLTEVYSLSGGPGGMSLLDCPAVLIPTARTHVADSDMGIHLDCHLVWQPCKELRCGAGAPFAECWKL